MAKFDPTQHEYLAIVSEWQGSGGAVGNAYPIYCLSTFGAVADPVEAFPNFGAIFLLSRAGFRTWDFVVVKPGQNTKYSDPNNKFQSYYIPQYRPTVLTQASQLESVATVLDHPGFDTGGNRQIVAPKCNVTPLFFVRKQLTYYGPLQREATTLSPMTDDLQRIDWRPLRDDAVIFEFTKEELEKHGVKFAVYQHPEQMNRVVHAPIELLVGKLRPLTSSRSRDALAEESLIEWYLQRCTDGAPNRDTLKAMQAAFKGRIGDDLMIQEIRLKRVEKLIASHSRFTDERERFAKQYVESAAGEKRLQEALEQTVAQRALQLQAEVEERERELADRRKELARQLEQAECDHVQQLEDWKANQEEKQRELEKLQTGLGQLKEQLAGEIEQIAGRMQDQIPILAAFASIRPNGGGTATGAVSVSATRAPTAARNWEFLPIAPERPLQTSSNEKQLVNALHLDLARQGLFFDRDFIANVYVCLKSEPLNLIIGPPGFGKSSLVAALARSLGHGPALLKIAVRRSWAEDRHLLGAFDSFHGRYDPGSTGLVPRMQQAAADWKGGRKGIYLVLLDEFNLAAPEYYFSQLLQALPGDDPVREIALYDPATTGGDGFPASIALTPNLRFWGTINYDETTERLSPRVLDRTGIIFLQETDVKKAIDRPTAPMPGVSAADLFGKFVKDADDCPTESWELVSPAVDWLRSTEAEYGPRIELSPRVQGGIRRYLANAAAVFEPRLAADFAVQQRVLPVLRGRGPGFLARIRRLQEMLFEKGLARSAQHVERALAQAEQQFGEIDFLAY